MRKIWSVILTVVLVVASVAAVPVSAAYVAADNITISKNVYDITCTVQTAVDGTMTAMLTNEAGSDLLGVATDSEPTDVKNAANETVGYKYVLTFRMETTDLTGYYKVRVGFRGDEATKTFSYASLDDQITFYNTLNGKASGEIKGYFVANPLLVPVDLTVYNAIVDTTVLGKVHDAIAALDLAVVPANATTEAKLAAIAPVDTAFTTAFADFMDVAAIVATSEADWPELVGTLQGAETFDKHYYDAEEVGVGAVTAAEVYDYFQTEIAAMSEYTVAEVVKAFDKATLALITDSRSTGILKSAFAYFAEGLGIDMTNIGTLTNNTDFWNDVKGLTTTDCDDLITKTEALAATAVEEGAGSTEGGTTGGVIIDKPTGDGAGGTLGNNTNKDEKPETPVTPVTPAGSFSDVANVEWAKDAIEALAKEGVLAGKGDGKFYPNDSVTREEFVKIIVAAFDLSDDAATCDFADVSKDSWSYSYIAAANKLGIVSGDGENFNPGAGISRQDMAVIIHRVFEHLGLEVSGETITFDDNAAIAGYAKDAVDALTAAGIINGMGDGTFAPAGTVTRAQAAKVVFGLLDLVGGGK